MSRKLVKIGEQSTRRSEQNKKRMFDQPIGRGSEMGSLPQSGGGGSFNSGRGRGYFGRCPNNTSGRGYTGSRSQ